MTLPLDGVLVADFSRVLAGPLATMTLADLGATVIKVERPGTGDDTRAWGPPWRDTPDGRVATYYESVNRGKRSVTLDLADENDRRPALELCRRADVFVENFRPGSLDRYGLGYEQLRLDNPGLIYASITGFGAHAGADMLGYDFVVQAVGGLMSITGEDEPMKAGVALVDVLTGKDTAIAVLGALAARERTGRGCHIEIQLLSSLLAALVNQASGYLGAGRVPGRMGNRHPSIAPYETLRCRDGLLAVACGNDGQFRRLTEALGVGDVADDERFATNAARVGHREQLVAALEAVLLTDDAAAWQQRLTEAGVPAGGVNDLAQAFALAESLGLHPVTDLGPGAARQVRHPAVYSEGLLATPTPPPTLGADSATVREWLDAPATTPLP
ncbi:MAG: CoA transferase [Mobilicoccus sp.]|nr:CoA transferase [Mobilicoccus sp.]